MIDFYAPWCGHCIKMSKDWDKFATKMKGSVNVAKIDATSHTLERGLLKLLRNGSCKK